MKWESQWVRLATACTSLKIAVVLEDVSLILVAEKLSKNPFMKAKSTNMNIDTANQNDVPDGFLR